MKMFFALIASLVLDTVHGANILGLFLYPDPNQHVVYQKIYKDLSLRGHHVTVVTTNPIDDPSLKNLKEINVDFTYDLVNNFKRVNKHSYDVSEVQTLRNKWDLVYHIAQKQLNSSQLQQLIWDDSKKFDLILRDAFVPVTHAFAFKFKAPVVDISGIDVLSTVNDRVGNPNHPVIYPDPCLDVKPGFLSLPEKYNSVYFFLWNKYYYYNVVMPKFDRLAKKYFGPDVPYIGDLELHISMMFVYRNPLLNSPRPNVPAAIEISPLGYEKPKSLPKDLQNFLDESKQGVIYVNFGPHITALDLGKTFKNNLLQAFAELPYSVLWQWNADVMPGKPSNVIIKKTFPQKDLLAHSNVKLFITSGDFISIEESITGEVPMIGIPFTFDQPRNIRRVVELGIAKRLNPRSVTKNSLKGAINKAIHSTTFRDNMKEVKDLLFDKPMTGLELAVWWSEYVIRHEGAKHLRSAAIDMPWYEYLLLDVISFLTTVILIGLYLCCKTFAVLTRTCLRYFRKSYTEKVKTN